jgi:hypothetical protein
MTASLLLVHRFHPLSGLPIRITDEPPFVNTPDGFGLGALFQEGKDDLLDIFGGKLKATAAKGGDDLSFPFARLFQFMHRLAVNDDRRS